MPWSLGERAVARLDAIAVPGRLSAQACHRKGANGRSRARFGSALGGRFGLGGEPICREPNAVPSPWGPYNQRSLQLGHRCLPLVPSGGRLGSPAVDGVSGKSSGVFAVPNL
eukprot:5734511-Heterocapsa_arctica.AAC.1